MYTADVHLYFPHMIGITLVNVYFDLECIKCPDHPDQDVTYHCLKE